PPGGAPGVSGGEEEAVDVLRRQQVTLADVIEFADACGFRPNHIESGPAPYGTDSLIELNGPESQVLATGQECRRPLLQDHKVPSTTIDRTGCAGVVPMILQTETA